MQCLKLVPASCILLLWMPLGIFKDVQNCQHQQYVNGNLLLSNTCQATLCNVPLSVVVDTPLLQEADVIFMPYNYLLDSTTRKALAEQAGTTATNHVTAMVCHMSTCHLSQTSTAGICSWACTAD
jgi:hypothetical protein